MWNYTYTDELYHYGVKGQKWGFRRAKAGSGKRTSSSKRRNESVVQSQNKKKKIKTALIIGGAATATALSVLGIYGISKASKNGSFMKKVKEGKDVLDFRREMKKPITQDLGDILREIG